MKYLYLLFIAALIFPVVVFAEPLIYFEAESYDFGEVKEGELLKHEFIFRNEGNEALIINGVVPS